MRMIITAVLMLGGLFFLMLGTLGLFRFKDVLTRVHATAKCDTLGAFLCILALIVYNGFGLLSVKLLIVVVFLWLTTPTATHLITKSEMAFRDIKHCEKEETELGEIIYIGEDDSNGVI